MSPEIDDPEILERVPDALRRRIEDGNGSVAYDAFHRRYPSVHADDVPFAEDALGDQWLLRDGQVVRLLAETGDVETLGLQPLLQLQREGGRLEPGQLINVYPPFCTKEAADGVSLRAVPAEEQHAFLWMLAEQLRDVPDGASVRFRIE